MLIIVKSKIQIQRKLLIVQLNIYLLINKFAHLSSLRLTSHRRKDLISSNHFRQTNTRPFLVVLISERYNRKPNCPLLPYTYYIFCFSILQTALKVGFELF